MVFSISYASVADELLKTPPKAYTRHMTAIKRLSTALLKLLFPNVQSSTDVEQIKRNIEKHNRTSRNILNKYAHDHIIISITTDTALLILISYHKVDKKSVQKLAYMGFVRIFCLYFD